MKPQEIVMLSTDGKIHFSCNECGTKFVATKEQIGKAGKCKNCGSPIAVPTPKGTQTKRTETGDSPKKKYGLMKYFYALVFAAFVIGIYLTPSPETADDYVAEYGGRGEVYQEIISMTDCNKLQEKFNIASKNNARASPGTRHFKLTMGYMEVAHNTMTKISCYE